MTTNTTKKILFSALMLSAVLAVTGMTVVHADRGEDRISEDELMERSEDVWKQKYDTDEEFFNAKNGMFHFVNNTHADNDWNRQVLKNQIIIYNFETKSGLIDSAMNTLLTDVQAQKGSGEYSPTEPERKFHEWAADQFPNPVPIEAKDKHLSKVIRALNSNANYGNVPADLFDSDLDYWLSVSSDKICDEYAECRNARDGTSTLGTAYGFIPVAYATEYSTYHLLTTYVTASSCETGSCKYSDSASGTGELSTNQGGGTNHVKTTTLQYHIKDISYVDNFDVSHSVTGTLQVGSVTASIGTVTGTNSVETTGSQYLGAKCGSSHCGVYNFSATAADATFET